MDEMTELDEALKVARENPDHGASFFYDAFLNAWLYIPAQRADKTTANWTQIAATDRFIPFLYRSGEQKAVPVFDSLERLKAWARERDFDYLILPTSLFLKAIALDVGIVLNDSTPHRHYFKPETLSKIRNAAQVVRPS